MSRDDLERWEQRYAAPGSDLHKGPHALLQRHAPAFQPGRRALELACGLGRDAVWLAEQGWTVDAVDISFTALRLGRALLHSRGAVGVNFVQADLDHFPVPRGRYDLVCVFRFLDRQLFAAIREAVRPGGLVIYETLNVRRLIDSPTTSPDHMLALGELPGYFPGWEVIETAEPAFYSGFVGRRPTG